MFGAVPYFSQGLHERLISPDLVWVDFQRPFRYILTYTHKCVGGATHFASEYSTDLGLVHSQNVGDIFLP